MGNVEMEMWKWKCGNEEMRKIYSTKKFRIGVGTRGARGAGAPLKFWYNCIILCYNVLLHGWCPPIETDLPTLLFRTQCVL